MLMHILISRHMQKSSHEVMIPDKPVLLMDVVKALSETSLRVEFTNILPERVEGLSSYIPVADTAPEVMKCLRPNNK